jgi:tetratricopeptide (TPR) repeat protein
MEKQLKPILIRILTTAILSILGCWTVYSNWPQRAIRFNNYSFSEEEAQRLRFYPKAQYAHGMHAWLQHKPERAGSCFRQAVSQDVLHLDAWLRLAEIEAALGRAEKARAILRFTTEMTDQVFRWKWSQMLLAKELGMENSLYRNTNFLLSGKVLVQDTLQLLHTHLDGDASAVVAVLEPAHLEAYLDWLMRWGMTDESLTVWQALTAVAEPDRETALRYAHFLVNHKRIDPSVDIWQHYTGRTGLTNPGFEKPISGKGFDWRYWGEKDGTWSLRRVNDETAEGNYALKITFNGQENIAFHHLYQIFAVYPHEKYRLTYEWKSRGITTDQGPFVEVSSYGKRGLYQAGPMITGSQGWHEKAIEFEIPADCRAAVVRLRRRASMRFDAKIRGMVWVDSFRLDKLETDAQTAATDTGPPRQQNKTTRESFQATR